MKALRFNDECKVVEESGMASNASMEEWAYKESVLDVKEST